MDKTKLAKFATAATITTGVAIALPVVAPFVAPFILPLMSGVLSETVAKEFGKSGVGAITGILGNLAASAIWESPNPLGKNPENQDLLRLLANAYLEAIKELDIEADKELKKQSQSILPLVEARIRRVVATKKEADLVELFPLNKNSKMGDLKYSFANRISSGDLILQMADESFTEDKILADEIEISIRRWFSEEKTFQNQTATDLTAINLSTELIPEPLCSFLRERLAKSIPQKIGELLKQPKLERSWIAFQRSHLQAILKAVNNKENALAGQTALSEEDRKLLSSLTELLSPLAKELDMLSKLAGVPEKIADLSQTCLIRFDSLETTLANRQAELLKAISEGRRRLLEELENIKKQIQELEKQITQGNLSLEEIKSTLANQTELIETFTISFGDLDILKFLAAENRRLTEKINSLPNSIPPISGFVGRKDYLDDLRESYQNGTRCFVLHGIGGVGKTALALEFAREIAGEYTAKIFVDMQGMSENPLSWQSAIFEVVRQFKREVPADISDAQLANLYVQFAQNQPTLIVLDNAAHKESVEALKRAEACLIVTSRESFVLTDGKSKQIIQMSPADARNLLFKNAGGEKRFDGQADELAKLAGYLPMALKPLAALLAEDELETATDLIEKYRDKKELLKERVPDYEDRTVEASFELSYEVLPAEMKERWRCLSVFPSDFDEKAIAAVLYISTEEAKETQKQLRRFSLLDVNAETRRFNLHDLLRTFSRTKPSAEEQAKAQLLFSRHYASILQRAAEIRSNDGVNGFVDALKLIDSELKNIVFGLNWAAHFTDQNNFIAEICCTYTNISAALLMLRLPLRTFINWQGAGLTAARKLGNKQYEGSSWVNLGVAYNNLGEYQNAIKCSEQSFAIFRETGDREGEGASLGNLGRVYNDLGNYEKAIGYSAQHFEISLEINDQPGMEVSLNNLGNSYFGLRSYEIAMDFHSQSLAISRALKNRAGEGQSLGNMANIYHVLGDYKEAINYQKQSLLIKREIGDRYGEGISLGNLGLAYLNSGEKEKACGLLKEALAILEPIESPSAKVFRQLIEGIVISGE